MAATRCATRGSWAETAGEISCPMEMPEKSAQHHSGLSCQAAIRKGLQGCTVTLTMRQIGTVRVLVDKVVESYAELETVARAFAAQQGYPWHKVAVVSK